MHVSATKIAESSAYNKSLLLTAPDISLTSIKNKRDPSIEPWGTPHEKFACEDRFQIHPLAVDDQINRNETIWIRLD